MAMDDGTVLFWLSSLAWSLLAPGTFLLLMLGIGAILAGLPTSPGKAAGTAPGTREKIARLGRWLRLGSLIALLGIAVLPLGEAMLTPLEHRFPPTALPEQADGLIVLGGGLLPEHSLGWGQPVLNEAGERLLAFALLAQRYPKARLIYSGGNNRLGGGPAEAAVAAPLLAELGIAPERLLLETASRNTFENVLYSQKLAQPRPEETWVVITSAAHMPRAIGVFRQAGWPVLPWPVDYRTNPAPTWSLRLDLTTGLERGEQGLREWLGLVAYRLTGRSSTLFPAPLP